MILPTNLRESLLAKLKEKGTTSICEICGQNTWSVANEPVGIEVLRLGPEGKPIFPPRAGIPAGALICNNCGNIRLFALAALGLLPSEKAEISTEKANG